MGYAVQGKIRFGVYMCRAILLIPAVVAFIADRIVRCHLQTMARMNVDYDLLTWEGDILRLKFWAQAFDVLKARGAVHLRTEGRLAGCWVMPIQEDLETTPNSQNVER